MQIAGLQKITLIDYPGKVAATVFTRGCSFRCPFCHNPELVITEKFNPIIPEEEIFSFLATRIGKLQAICITGGEPTLQADLLPFIKKVKELGFLVKLDTNGWNPKVLEEIIKSGEVDYIAMDIKATPNKYLVATGIMNYESSIMEAPAYHSNQKNGVISTHPEPTAGWIEGGEKSHHNGTDKLMIDIKKSISLIMDSGLDYEFRTTVCHPIHAVEDFAEIGKLIKDAKRYFIQNFVESKQISELQKFTPFSDEELEKSKKIVSEFVTNSYSR